MSTGPKHGWGGKRERSGRKATPLDQMFLKRMVKVQRKWEKLAGKSIDDILMMIIHAQDEAGIPVDVGVKDRISAIKIYKEFTMLPTKTDDRAKNEDHQARGRVLPAMRPDPADLVPKAGNA